MEKFRFLAFGFCFWALASTSSSHAQVPSDLTLEFVAGGFSSPVAIRHAGDGSGRLFIVEQGGLIRIVDDGSVLPTPFLDLQSLVVSGGEQGLLGLAFHPDYSTNGLFYVNYTRDGDPDVDKTVIARYSVSADPNVADSTSATLILEIDQPFENHNGGDIHFGPDDYLYIGMGDGGGWETAQDMTTLLGKMLRIDVDGGSPYAIPPDNPFVGDPSALDEIWASGLRNPWRWSFDRLTGDLFIGDVGEGDWEEIDYQPAASSGGENYGWPCREGAHDFLPAFCPGSPTLVEPILEYSHDSGQCTVVGGFVFRGGIQGFDGTYVYNDWCTGELWFANEVSPGVWSSTLWDTVAGFNLVGYGEGEDGTLYLAMGEEIQRFHSASGAATIFTDGFESGDLTLWSSVSP